MDQRIQPDGLPSATDHTPTVRGSIGMLVVLFGALVVASYPVVAAAIVVGVLGTLAGGWVWRRANRRSEASGAADDSPASKTPGKVTGEATVATPDGGTTTDTAPRAYD